MARGVLLAFLAVLMAGFGLCGLWGSAMGVSMFFDKGEEHGLASLPLIFGLIGLALAWGFWLAVRA